MVMILGKMLGLAGPIAIEARSLLAESMNNVIFLPIICLRLAAHQQPQAVLSLHSAVPLPIPLVRPADCRIRGA